VPDDSLPRCDTVEYRSVGPVLAFRIAFPGRRCACPGLSGYTPLAYRQSDTLPEAECDVSCRMRRFLQTPGLGYWIQRLGHADSAPKEPNPKAQGKRSAALGMDAHTRHHPRPKGRDIEGSTALPPPFQSCLGNHRGSFDDRQRRCTSLWDESSRGPLSTTTVPNRPRRLTAAASRVH